jgi:hypothetical protein
MGVGALRCRLVGSKSTCLCNGTATGGGGGGGGGGRGGGLGPGFRGFFTGPALALAERDRQVCDQLRARCSAAARVRTREGGEHQRERVLLLKICLPRELGAELLRDLVDQGSLQLTREERGKSHCVRCKRVPQLRTSLNERASVASCCFDVTTQSSGFWQHGVPW